MWQYIISVFVGFISYYIFHNIYKRNDTPIELLKNALLTYVLMKIKNTDVDIKTEYTLFDGTKLPMLSGCNLSMGCFTYMNKLKYWDPLYSNTMNAKICAIEKYLKQNLNTNEKVLHLFEQYTEQI